MPIPIGVFDMEIPEGLRNMYSVFMKLAERFMTPIYTLIILINVLGIQHSGIQSLGFFIAGGYIVLHISAKLRQQNRVEESEAYAALRMRMEELAHGQETQQRQRLRENRENDNSKYTAVLRRIQELERAQNTHTSGSKPTPSHKELEQLKNLVGSQKTEITSLRASLNGANYKITRLETKINDVSKANGGSAPNTLLLSRIQDLEESEAQTAKNLSTNKDVIDAHTSMIRATNIRISDTEGLIHESKTDHQILHSQLSALETKLREIVTELHTQNLGLQEKTMQITECVGKIKEMDSALMRQGNVITEKDAKIEFLHREIKKGRAVMNGQEKALKVAVGKVKGLETRFAEFARSVVEQIQMAQGQQQQQQQHAQPQPTPQPTQNAEPEAHLQPPHPATPTATPTTSPGPSQSQATEQPNTDSPLQYINLLSEVQARLKAKRIAELMKPAKAAVRRNGEAGIHAGERKKARLAYA